MRILFFLPLIYSFPFQFMKSSIPFEDEYLQYLTEFNKIDHDPKTNAFSSFLFQFKKKDYYNDDNFNIFKKNYQYIQAKNNELNLMNNSFELGMNPLFDVYSYENISHYNLNEIISSNYTIEKKYKKYRKNPFYFLQKILQLRKQKEFNWNNTNYLSPVKNQKKCGSCWAFSSTNTLETFMRSKGFPVTRLSEQELVDCSDENNGCNGGFMHTAFDYIIREKGLTSEEDYPYVAETMDCKHENCIVNENKYVFPKVVGSSLAEYDFTIPKSIPDRLISVQISPICIALDASSVYFQFYKSGVIDIEIENQKLNHAVILIGYGTDENGLYWVIQNSWGSQWGDNGFCKIRVKEGDGILLSNLYGVYPTKIA